jgi:crotonobetainyl-CoA:carnitine CoA-transferase CaiB-like acyl-CoA transferase
VQTTTTGPLHGIRVLDLTRVLAGPFATMILADLGADVIKVERPGGGDDTRGFGPPFLGDESTYFLSINRGKRSIVVNMKTEEGQQVLQTLAGRSDVLVENFRAGVLDRVGMGYDVLSTRYERLIYASISGFGHDGLDEFAKAPGYDLLVQSLSGVVSLTGFPDGPGTKAGISIGDLVGGLYCVHGILAALYAREKTGRGQRVDISMLDGLASLLTYQAGSFLGTGDVPLRMGSRHPSICPFEIMTTQDGQLAICCGNDGQFERLVKALGLPDLVDDDRFSTNVARVGHREELLPLLMERFGAHSTAHWLAVLAQPDVDVPSAPVQTVEGALEHPQLQARGMLRTMTHPTAGTLRVVGCPIRMGGQSLFNERPAPVYGEHTEQILRELGLSDD